MADEVKYYKIKPRVPFTAARTPFFPDREYHVTPEVYNSQVLDDGTKVSDLCSSAEAITKQVV